MLVYFNFFLWERLHMYAVEETTEEYQRLLPSLALGPQLPSVETAATGQLLVGVSPQQ